MNDKEKQRILKRYIKDLLYNINFNNFNACKRIIDNIKELKGETIK
jgi:hypothetical protein